MATAVQTSTPPGTPNPRVRLALSSLFVALLALGGVVATAYLVPDTWRPRILAQIVVAIVTLWVGARLAGVGTVRGLKGGIFLALVALALVAYLTRFIGFYLEDTGYGLPVTLAVLGALLTATWFFLTSSRAQRWMHAIEEQGWFDFHQYKRSQGIRMRRYTLIGFLLIGLTGVASLVTQEMLGSGDWKVRIPYTGEPPVEIALLSHLKYSVPIILAALTFWVAWRAVNMPTFADFLIATEAEMNKVSWSSRRRLAQDTIVVLTTVLLLTGFLLVVDLFWGWLLSRELIGVLPPRSQTVGAPVDPTQGKKVEW